MRGGGGGGGGSSRLEIPSTPVEPRKVYGIETGDPSHNAADNATPNTNISRVSKESHKLSALNTPHK